MKVSKWMALLVAVAMLLALGACGSSDTTTDDSQQNTNTDTTQIHTAGRHIRQDGV